MRLRLLIPLTALCCLLVAVAHHVVTTQINLAQVSPNQHINGIAWLVQLPGYFLAVGLGGGVHGDLKSTTETVIIVGLGGLFWAMAGAIVIWFGSVILRGASRGAGGDGGAAA
jgi:hypothetical protein